MVAKRYIKAALIDLGQNPEPEPRPREADIARPTVGEEAHRFQIGHRIVLSCLANDTKYRIMGQGYLRGTSPAWVGAA